MMRNPFKLSALDHPYAERLEEILVDDLYRRAPVPVVMLLPVLGVFYSVLAAIVPERPVIGWIFVALFLLVIPRLVIVLCADRIKARYPNAHQRLLFFAVPTVVVGLGMSAINLLAAPLITADAGHSRSPSRPVGLDHGGHRLPTAGSSPVSR